MIELSRAQWGANAAHPRKGHHIGPLHRTEVFIHHTTVIDRDETANTWDSLAQVRARMRTLQTLREQDLGADVPYNHVAFCMASGELVLCEGRGLGRTGAHTTNHNRSALGIAFQGNFEAHALPAYFDQQLQELAGWLGRLRRTGGFERLGDVRPANAQVFGHRDVRATLCPGGALYKRLNQIVFIDEEQQMDKPSWKLVQRALQTLEPPLYRGRIIDGKPGRNTHTAVQAFERRLDLEPRGVLGTANDPVAGIWPTTREMLLAMTAARS